MPGSTRLYWLCQAIGWGLYFLGNLAGGALLLHVPAGPAAVDMLILSGLGLVCSHVMRSYMRARGWAHLPKAVLIARVVLASIIGGIAIATVKILSGLAPWQTDDFHAEAAPVRHFLVLLVPTLNWTCMMAAWCGLYFGALTLREQRWARLRESELARALQLSELGRLKSQLNPHYLFNALNTVRALIAIDPAAAQQAVTQLARTLRYTLSSGQEDLVTLAQELATVEDYLALESLRLDERLKVEWDVSEAARSIRIPVMLLQTLVENAIKHGIAELPSGGTLKVRARLEGGVLDLAVENGCPSQVAGSSTPGIGLRNATERLRHLFGANASLELDISTPAQGTSQHALAVAHVKIPSPP